MSTEITPDRLRSLFRPRTVALVGASDKSMFSVTAYGNLVDFGFADRTFLVNRRGVTVHGRPSVRTCSEIGEPVDVAFMQVPQAGTLDALSDAAAAGIRNAVILSSGYGEAGAEGKRAQQELVDHARSLDMLVLGPNHLGFANFVDQVPVTPVPGLPHHAGAVALLSQSGASSSAMVDFATMADADLSYMVTLGNEAMITAGHVLDFLVDDDATKAIAIFMETIREPRVFAAAARRAAAAGKAIVVLKAGSSALSARTAAAHTGALVGDDKTVDTVFRELGVIRVDSIEDMMITASAAAALGRLDAPGIGWVSISGGACDIVADRAEDLGAELPEFAPRTRERLRAVMPDYGTVQNPLDVTGAAIIDPTLFTKAIEAVADDPGVGVVAVISGAPWQSTGGPNQSQPLLNAIGGANASTPVTLVNQVLQPITDYTKSVLAEAKIAHLIPGLRQSVVALRNLAWWSGTIGGVTAVPEAADPVTVTVAAPREGAWSESTAREALSQAGIPVIPSELVTGAEQAVTVAAGLGGPVALKIASPDILHKSDIGGVALDVAGDDAVADAYRRVTAAAAVHAPDARIEGVLISPMRSGGVELLVGVVRDPHWGPVLAVAIGGIFVEVLGDSALATLPVTPDRARGLLDRLRGKALLHGVRGTAAADLDAVAAVIARVGDLALALGDDLESLEINPLRVDGSTVEALDAVITWAPAGATEGK
ncbi:acetate--CoA ligase family protein [Nocardia sp. alder85J]|uniref:acetate--CoA ligase family protein n=1 Tax=Nocardia sp. alder85J TaxID=2862949 RepID=UPI001CD3116B|nr:acetate--CoA ligase family protein [Nocardia sp. alder85J]MCX4098600.1 acetate--CoA ligase family protein [Nocardia sp. alder85J]